MRYTASEFPTPQALLLLLLLLLLPASGRRPHAYVDRKACREFLVCPQKVRH